MGASISLIGSPAIWRSNSFSENASNLFGLDQGALVGFEFRYGVARHLQAAVYRTTINKTFQFHGKYDAIRQSGPSPVSASALVSIEGTDNFSDEFSPALGAVVSHQIGDAAALYAVPVWVHNTGSQYGTIRAIPATSASAAGFASCRPSTSPPRCLHASVVIKPGQAEYGFAIEKRAGGHMFQLNFTNTFSTTYGQVARGGFEDSLYLGFNLARKFF